MRRATTSISQLVILCKNVQKSAEIYSQSLGLKIVVQSPEIVELKDSRNLRVFLKATKLPYEMTKGYSPIISFNVENFDEVRKKLLHYNLTEDGEIIETSIGKIANFVGPEGQHICINSLSELQDPIEATDGQEKDLANEEIKNLLNKIKM